MYRVVSCTPNPRLANRVWIVTSHHCSRHITTRHAKYMLNTASCGACFVSPAAACPSAARRRAPRDAKQTSRVRRWLLQRHAGQVLALATIALAWCGDSVERRSSRAERVLVLAISSARSQRRGGRDNRPCFSRATHDYTLRNKIMLERTTLLAFHSLAIVLVC